MARTVRTKVYQFDELGKDAQKKAIEWYRNGADDAHIHAEEIIDSIKAVCGLFNLETGREWTDIRTGHIDDTILELRGVRLYKYLVNNFWDSLYSPKYIKMIDRELRCKQFICKVGKDYKGNPYTQLFSKMRRVNDGCPLTGVCYDNDILQPIYDFLENPQPNTTYADLIQGMEDAMSKCFRDMEEDVNSDEYIIETIIANEYEFTADGRRF